MKLINDEWLTKEECYEKHKRLIYNSLNKFIYRGKKQGYEYDDLYQLGATGLILAYDRFDSEKGFMFSTLAISLIRGTIFNELRDRGNLIHHTRRAFQLSGQITQADMADESVTVIMNHFNAKRKHVEEALCVMNGSYSSLQTEIGKGTDLESMMGAEEDFSKVHIEEFLNLLNDRDRSILSNKMMDMSQREISEKVGISQVQVSRELRKIGKQFKMYNNL